MNIVIINFLLLLSSSTNMVALAEDAAAAENVDSTTYLRTGAGMNRNLGARRIDCDPEEWCPIGFQDKAICFKKDEEEGTFDWTCWCDRNKSDQDGCTADYYNLEGNPCGLIPVEYPVEHAPVPGPGLIFFDCKPAQKSG